MPGRHVVFYSEWWITIRWSLFLYFLKRSLGVSRIFKYVINASILRTSKHQKEKDTLDQSISPNYASISHCLNLPRYTPLASIAALDTSLVAPESDTTDLARPAGFAGAPTAPSPCSLSTPWFSIWFWCFLRRHSSYSCRCFRWRVTDDDLRRGKVRREASVFVAILLGSTALPARLQGVERLGMWGRFWSRHGWLRRHVYYQNGNQRSGHDYFVVARKCQAKSLPQIHFIGLRIRDPVRSRIREPRLRFLVPSAPHQMRLFTPFSRSEFRCECQRNRRLISNERDIGVDWCILKGLILLEIITLSL